MVMKPITHIKICITVYKTTTSPMENILWSGDGQKGSLATLEVPLYSINLMDRITLLQGENASNRALIFRKSH